MSLRNYRFLLVSAFTLFAVAGFTIAGGANAQFSSFGANRFDSGNFCAYGERPVCATAITACETGTCRLPERTFGNACVAFSFGRPIVQEGACLQENSCSKGHDLDLATGLCVSRELARRQEFDPEDQILQRPECPLDYIYSQDEGRCIVDREIVLQNACEQRRYRWSNGYCRSKPGKKNGAASATRNGSVSLNR